LPVVARVPAKLIDGSEAVGLANVRQSDSIPQYGMLGLPVGHVWYLVSTFATSTGSEY